jgi:DNA-binding CsgD family transcriptional regulator
MRDGDPDRSTLVGLAVLLGAMAVTGTVDLIFDLGQDSAAHRAVGASFALLGLGGVALLAGRLRSEHRELRSAQAALVQRGAERDAWQARASNLLEGLGAAIDHQFEGWHLTGAERETALFLLKGYSHRDIATLTGRSERTVRQHSVAVYRKSGLHGRAELAAFFLEDLLLPARDEAASARPDG